MTDRFKPVSAWRFAYREVLIMQFPADPEVMFSQLWRNESTTGAGRVDTLEIPRFSI